MLKLLLDSAGAQAVFALAIDDQIQSVVEFAPQMGDDRVRVFLQVLQDLCGENQAKVTDLEAIYAVTGPGRYTGIRLGLSMVQGLRLGTDIRTVGLRRDTAYAPLLAAKTGIFLCDSGKVMAYGGVWQDGVLDDLGLIDDTTALQLAVAHGAGQVLALLPEQHITQHYGKLLQAGMTVTMPTVQARAQSLLQASCHHDDRADDSPLQPWYQEAAVQ